MTGVAVVMGDDRSPNSTYVQMAGRGHRIQVDHLRKAMQSDGSIQVCFLNFAQAFMTQTAHAVLANGRANVNQRLARWILMAHARTSGNDLPFAHEFLAIMLGVRRASVTIAVQALEDSSIVSTKRGLIVVQDRAGLEEIASPFYGVPEAEYTRLISSLSSAKFASDFGTVPR